jgi:hypothetical protein
MKCVLNQPFSRALLPSVGGDATVVIVNDVAHIKKSECDHKYQSSKSKIKYFVS